MTIGIYDVCFAGFACGIFVGTVAALLNLIITGFFRIVIPGES